MNERIREHAQPTQTSTHISGVLQRKCDCGQHTIAGGECEACGKQQLQRRVANQAEPAEAPSIVHDVLRSPGQPLDAETRAILEPRFAHDFSHVRLHTDAKAAESAQAVNALAYTVGRDVVFGARQYAPKTVEGQRLMAHELTHVVQQQGLGNLPETLALGDTGDALERDADRVALSIADGEQRPTGRLQSSGRIQRVPRGDDDPIHRPMIDQFRGERGLPQRGVDEARQPGDPTDAEIKYRQQVRVIRVTVPAPATQTLSAEQARAMSQPPPNSQIVSTPSPTSPAPTSPTRTPENPPAPAAPAPAAPAPAAPTPARTNTGRVFSPLAREPVQFGFDFTSDSNLGQQLTILPRHLDAFRFSFLGAPIDVLHEPGLTAGVSLDPTSFGVISGGVAGTLLNIHFQDHGWDFIELALGQGGLSLDTTGALTLTVGGQAEIHSRNNHFSIAIGGGGTVTRMPNGAVTTAFSPLTFTLIVHILNP
jgi:hypothetical protein